jgi:hypothetical protein
VIGMQYRITLPGDYDMGIIRDRVRLNGSKTDGFDGLFFKCYIIKEKDVDGFENAYEPLYLWKDSEGMNKFLFGGYYDNILRSFGWQRIKIGIPVVMEITDSFSASAFGAKLSGDIPRDITLTGFSSMADAIGIQDKSYTGRVCLYNPDTWRYTMYWFYEQRPQTDYETFQILHISR